jgi:hypothetical protein
MYARHCNKKTTTKNKNSNKTPKQTNKINKNKKQKNKTKQEPVNMKGRFKIKLYLSINRNMHEIACYGQKLPTSNKPFLNIFNDYQKYFYL